MCEGWAHVDHVYTTDHLVHCAEAQLRHQLPDLLREVEEEVDNMLRRPSELLSKLRILGCDTDRAGIQVTLPHHDATQSNERCGRETEFLSTQQSGDHDVPTRLQFTVNLYANTAAQVVHHQHLLRL